MYNTQYNTLNTVSRDYINNLLHKRMTSKFYRDAVSKNYSNVYYFYKQERAHFFSGLSANACEHSKGLESQDFNDFLYTLVMLVHYKRNAKIANKIIKKSTSYLVEFYGFNDGDINRLYFFANELAQRYARLYKINGGK